MPYDPNLPQENTLIDAAQMRAQLTGLKDLIDALPTINNAVIDSVSTGNPGDPASVMLSVSGGTLHFSFSLPRGNDGGNGTNGSDGNVGPPFTNFIIDGVTTLNPGQPATAQAVFDGNAVRLLFGLPRGSDGTNGSNGSDGGQGAPGVPGVPFTNFVIDGVITLNPGDPATVTATFDGNAVRLVFGIPRGSEGTPGVQGPPGPLPGNFIVDGVTTLNPGESATVQTFLTGSDVHFQFGIPRGQNGNDGGTGPQGQPGEVTSMQLNSAINGTSSNSNSVSTLDTPFANDPPTLADLELMRAKMNELITALRR